jgi:hypothetical protein
MPDDESTTPETPEATPEPTDEAPGAGGGGAGNDNGPGGNGDGTENGADADGDGNDNGDGGTTAVGTAGVLSRKELRAQRNHHSRAKWYVLAGVAVLLVGGVVTAVLAGGAATKKKAVPPTTTTTAVPPVVVTCPLTGTPAPGNVVPARPVIAAKIGNYTGDRPSAGLNQADVVFEEPVEGSYTRLVAVFQCQGAALVGDLRSAREPDVAILSQLSNPIFVHAGGIYPVLNLLANAPIQDRNILDGGLGSITLHPSGRYAPYAMFTNTAAVWATNATDTAPPAPLFTFTPAPQAGAVPGSGTAVHVPFSTEADVTWTWNPATSAYLRSYSGVPDTLVDGTRTSASNVVVMTVPTFIGPWVENSEGGHEVEVTATGSGPVVVLRDGMAISGTWTRTSLSQPATLTAADGAPITLHPGTTWEELAPQGIPVTTTAAPPPPPPTTTSVPVRSTPSTTRP